MEIANSVCRSVFAFGLVVSVAGPALAQSFDGTCVARTGSTGGKSYVTAKCKKKDANTRYYSNSIEATVWENKDPKAYADMARSSGTEFSCTLTKTGSRNIDDQLVDIFRISDCHSGRPARATRQPRGEANTATADPQPNTECWVCKNNGSARAYGEYQTFCLGKGQILSTEGMNCRRQ